MWSNLNGRSGPANGWMPNHFVTLAPVPKRYAGLNNNNNHDGK